MPTFLRHRWVHVLLGMIAVLIGITVFLFMPFGLEQPARLPAGWQPAPEELAVTWSAIDEESDDWLRFSPVAYPPEGVLFTSISYPRRGKAPGSILELFTPDGGIHQSPVLPARAQEPVRIQDRLFLHSRSAPNEILIYRLAWPELTLLDPPIQVMIPPTVQTGQRVVLRLEADGDRLVLIAGDLSDWQLTRLARRRMVARWVLDPDTGAVIEESLQSIACEANDLLWSESANFVIHRNPERATRIELRTGEETAIALSAACPSEIEVAPPASAKPLPPGYLRNTNSGNGTILMQRESKHPPLYWGVDAAAPPHPRWGAKQPKSLWTVRAHTRATLTEQFYRLTRQSLPAAPNWDGGLYFLWPDAEDAPVEPLLVEGDTQGLSWWVWQQPDAYTTLEFAPLDAERLAVSQGFSTSPPWVNGGHGGVRFGIVRRGETRIDWRFWIPLPVLSNPGDAAHSSHYLNLEGEVWTLEMGTYYEVVGKTPVEVRELSLWTEFPNSFLDAESDGAPD